MEPGAKAIISGNDHTATCTLEAWSPPGLLPPIEGAPDPAEVAAICAEWGVDEIAAWSFVRPDLGRVVFIALHIPPHGWYDMQRHPLYIAPLVDLPPLDIA